MRLNLSRMLLLLAICQLLAFARADSAKIEVKGYYQATEGTLKNIKHFTLEMSAEQVDQVDTNSMSVFVTIEGQEGNGEWSLSGREHGSKEADSSYHKTDGLLIKKKPEIVAISSQSAMWPEIKSSKKIYLTVKNTGAETEPIKFIIVAQASEYLNAPTGGHYFVHVSKLRELKVKTKITASKGNHHYKFMMEERSHYGIPILTGFGVKKSSDGKSDIGNFNFLRFDHHRIGYVIDQTDSNLYCAEGACDYELTATFENIKVLEIFFGEHIDFELIGEDQSSVTII